MTPHGRNHGNVRSELSCSCCLLLSEQAWTYTAMMAPTSCDGAPPDTGGSCSGCVDAQPPSPLVAPAAGSTTPTIVFQHLEFLELASTVSAVPEAYMPRGRLQLCGTYRCAMGASPEQHLARVACMAAQQRCLHASVYCWELTVLMQHARHSPDETWLSSSFRLGVPEDAVAAAAAAGCAAASASATAAAAADARFWSPGGCMMFTGVGHRSARFKCIRCVVTGCMS